MSATEFAANLSTVDENATYYSLTLTADEAGHPQINTQTQFVGFGSKPLWELRVASPVDAHKMRAAWALVKQASIVVNNEAALAYFRSRGGNAVIEETLLQEHFGQLLEPVECAPSRFGEGARPISAVTSAQLRHAPTLKHRTSILTRDQFRCKGCGQRPADDFNVQLHVHHVRPHGQGGLTEDENLLTLCHTCHNGLDPHYEPQLLDMIPDGLGVPLEKIRRKIDEFELGVHRYRDHVAAVLLASNSD